jgi:aminoglycoside phosphotransferase family enzyme/predicted kinase
MAAHARQTVASGHMVDDLLAELREQAKRSKDRREVGLVETHISWVLLGPEVYKIKKPVALPFLDFSTFEARERACRTETRINRRLAPRTYLGVVPVRRRSDGRYTFGAGGVITDWAVRMVRLDEARRADALLAKGELGRVHVDALARAIAAFHASAAGGPPIARFGAPELVEDNVRENFTALRGAGPAIVSDEALAEIERWQHAFLRDRREPFEQRMRGGFIRDGHGDLRLEHVFFRAGDEDFEIIDGIEFDDRYRYGDVCADVAFFAMDLARLGRVDLAERFLATYARAANDFDLYALVDFYESYRACVRAKIAVGIATSPNGSSLIRDAAAKEARRYLLFAQAARRRSVLDPVLVAVAGGIASGKSTLAERLGEELSAPVVDADRTRKHMLGIAPSSHEGAAPAWQGAYDPAFSSRVYEEVLRRAGVVLASGRPVIVDASFRTAELRAAARDLARRHDVPFRLIECDAPEDLRRARLRARDPASSVSDATANVFDAFTAGYEPITELGPTEHVRVDTSGSVEAALAEARREIETWPRGLVQ